jgi:D-glycero-alpha-D-manno-heptose-7-phosphate kinase
VTGVQTCALPIFKDPLEITAISEVPSRTGLGSSSTFTVGLLHALHRYRHESVTPAQLAEEASHIEINILKSPIGKQDQYAAAYGGLNKIIFTKDGVSVHRLYMPYEVKRRLMMYYVGKRNQGEGNVILGNITTDIEKQRHIIDKIRTVAMAVAKDFETRQIEDSLGDWLDIDWVYKQDVNNRISAPGVDLLYKTAIKNGAIGGKLLGAGGSGFLLVYIRPTCKMEKMTARRLLFEIDTFGSVVLYEE